MNKWFVILSISSLFLLSACGGTDEHNQENPVNEGKKEVAQEEKVDSTNKEIEISENPLEENKNPSSVVVEKKELYNEENGYTLHVTIPQFSGLEDKDQENYLNKHFLSYGKQFAEEILKVESLLLENEDDKLGIHAIGEIDFETKLQNENVVSVLVTQYDFQGGMHGLLVKLPYTIDIKTGNILSLSDLFTTDDYIPLLTDLIKEQIAHSELGSMLIFPFESIKEDEKFYLTKDHLVIVFDPYEYTAGAAGSPEFKIDKSKLPNLKDEYR